MKLIVDEASQCSEELQTRSFLARCVHPSRGMAGTQDSHQVPSRMYHLLLFHAPCGFHVKSREEKLKLCFCLWRRKRSAAPGWSSLRQRDPSETLQPRAGLFSGSSLLVSISQKNILKGLCLSVRAVLGDELINY